ncbi:MAG: hypothetical protein HY521_15025 [Proteobacteria bacterium]|nr:hypothetical protein [Pseudomonadota bacterium]
MPFRPKFRQRLQLRQPSERAFRFLREAGGEHLINRIELSLDLISESPRAMEEVTEFVTKSWVRRWKRCIGVGCVSDSTSVPKRRHPRALGPTTYWGRKGRPVRPALYMERYSRVSGEMFCTHLDWRVGGAEGVRAIGIESLADLITFDHQTFWSERLIFRAVDFPKLGRAWLETKRRSDWFRPDWRGVERNEDERVGRIIAAAGSAEIGPIVQNIIDFARKCGKDIGKALIPIPCPL